MDSFIVASALEHVVRDFLAVNFAPQVSHIIERNHSDIFILYDESVFI